MTEVRIKKCKEKKKLQPEVQSESMAIIGKPWIEIQVNLR
jgi:hypothetical protein